MKLKFSQVIYCAGKWNYHTVNTNLILSNVFVVAEILVVVAHTEAAI